jgi:ABC-type Zn uptake system ZnuABC Zn-binding protein ZnuA
VKLYVANIRDALAGVDPAGASDYRARATAYLAKLDELDAEIKKPLKPFRRRAGRPSPRTTPSLISGTLTA